MFLHTLLLIFSLKIADASEQSINRQLDGASSLCQAALTGNVEVIEPEVFFNEDYLDRITEVNDVEAIVDEFYRIRNPFMLPHQYSSRERSLVIQLVKALKGNVTKAAKELNLSPPTLHEWVLKYEDLYDEQIRNVGPQRNTYTDEEKDRAIRRVMELGGNVAKSARELNIAPKILRVWVIAYEETNNVQIRNTKVYPARVSDEEFLRAIELVTEYGGHMSKAARELGIPSTTLHRWVIHYEDKHDVQVRNTKVYPTHVSDEEFLRSIELVIEYEGRVSKAAKELGIPSTTLHRWVIHYEEEHNVQIRNSRAQRRNLN